MKPIYLAKKSSYGTEFCEEFDTLEELKKAIVAHEHQFCNSQYTPEMYTEKLFKQVSGSYLLYEVKLHEDECIFWHEYDGQSWFTIEKQNRSMLSTKTLIK